MDADALLRTLMAYRKQLGLIGLLVLTFAGVLVGGWRQWWVFGWQYHEACAQRDDARAELRQLREALAPPSYPNLAGDLYDGPERRRTDRRSGGDRRARRPVALTTPDGGRDG